MSKYYIEVDGKPEPCDLMDWALGKPEQRIVARTRVGEVLVSTVFLGLDHNITGVGAPILYETMIFGGAADQEQERYETREAAIVGHAGFVLAEEARHGSP
jgi:hypothetical protein